MPALYRTYRPKRFSEVVGQSHIVQTLKNAVTLGTPSHAYLFSGGRGLGKTTLARVLARALNCLEVKNGEACLSCRVCREMDAGSFLDLMEVDAASNTGVDNVRSLIETVRFQPASGAYKVYIIDEAHMLSKGAWNALLKTLEEPPPATVFVLATTESGKVPATIHSRAQSFNFKKFSETELNAQLQAILKQEKKKLSEEVTALIAHTANGGMRDALTLLDQVLSLGDAISLEDAQALLGVTDRRALVELLQLIHQGNTAELPAYFERLSSRYFDMLAVNRDLLELLRGVLASRIAGGDLFQEEREWFSEQDLLFLVRQFLRSYKELSSTPDPVLPLLIASLEAALKLHSAVVPALVPASKSALPAPSITSTITPSRAQSKPALAVVAEKVTTQREQASVVATAVSTAVLEETKVRELWPEVCDKLRAVNGPLATLVRNSPICVVESNSIVLGVKYLFHKEQLESVKSRQLIATGIQEVFGVSAYVSAQFIEREEEDQVTPTETLSQALKIFGGELVE